MAYDFHLCWIPASHQISFSAPHLLQELDLAGHEGMKVVKYFPWKSDRPANITQVRSALFDLKGIMATSAAVLQKGNQTLL